MTPGDEVKFTVDVKNDSNVAVKYRLTATSSAIEGDGKVDLTKALTCNVSIGGNVVTMDKDTTTFTSAWIDVAAGETIPDIEVQVMFPNGTPEHDNQFQDGTANIAFVLEAVQANGIDANGNYITD